MKILIALLLGSALLLPACKRAQKSDTRPAQSARAPSRALGLHFPKIPGGTYEHPEYESRKLQVRLPGAKGSGDAQLLVSYFGPHSGGGVAANLRRWRTQFHSPSGGLSEDVKVDTHTVDGMQVHEMSDSGTFQTMMGVGGGQSKPEKGYAMRAAIVEAPDGNYFVKLLGPKATVEHWAGEWQKFIDGIRRRGGTGGPSSDR